VAIGKQREHYLGNPNLPTANTSFEYTPEMIKEIKKSSDDIVHFASTYFYIISLDEGRKCIELHKCQKRVLKKMMDNRFFILLASRQIGKALALDTPIPTPNGWTTMGELKQGDQVYGLDGKPCNILCAHDVMYGRPCYKITFDNGETIIADEEHLWFTESKNERYKGGTVKTTGEICKTLLAGKEPNHRIPMCINGVTYESSNLPIDPYVLGMWLGDGTSSGATISIGKRDLNETIDTLKTYQSQFDKLTLHEYYADNYTLRLSTTSNVKTKSLSTLLHDNNLIDNKHIPTAYLQSSRQQRLKLLQGLIDSDGYINKNGVCQFYNTNIRLVKQVKELVESLGYKVTFKQYTPTLNGVECAECGCITFTPIEYVATLMFKKSRIKPKPLHVQSKFRSQWHYIKNVEKIDSVPVRCITVDSKDNLFLCGRQYIPTHNTTLMTIYALWFACFNDDQKVLIVANKEGTAKEIFSRIRLAYEELPNWLKAGVKEYGKESMVLSNGSSIGISTTTGTAARGMSVSLLILDELAFIEPHIVNEFWKSVFPIVSSSKKSKIFIASTANGTDNLFYDIYSKAEANKNNWAYDKVLWSEIPGRNLLWRREMILALGSEEAFDQEFGCKFIQTGESAVDEKLFAHLKKNIRQPQFVLDEGKYYVYKDPEPNGVYVVGVDVAEGLGENYTSIQILDLQDLTNIEQVATYNCNTIAPIHFTKKLHEILTQWGNPLVSIERNNCGGQVIDQLFYSYNYTNILTYGYGNSLKIATNKKGITSHSNIKFKGVMNKRYWLKEQKAVAIRDENTLKELKNFVRYPNGSWKARPGADVFDDRVMSLVWALIVLDNELVEKYFHVEKYDENKRPLIIKPYHDTSNVALHSFNSIYNGMNNLQQGLPTPFVFTSNEGEPNEDLDELKAMGYSFLHQQRY